jgi:two-component system, OmpR family, phosphate regulon sensor histidine kinase PhoR
MNRDKILIVDDEPDIALILKLQLEDAGFKTVRARDGIEALECLARETFELILLDVKMPRMDGLQVLSRIMEKNGNDAVIMMTAHGSEDIAVDAMKNGAIDYIAKPFSTEEIVKKVEHAIRFNRTRQENLVLQQKLEEERKKTEAILQGMADLLIAVDAQGHIMTVNRKAEEVLGASRDILVGKRVEEALKADIPPELLPCRVVLRTSVPCLDVAYIIGLDDTGIPVLSSATPLFNGAGQLAGAVEIIRDISKLKKLEQEKEDFVGMLSHDLKTPITSIVGALDLVREGRLGKVNEEQKDYLEMAVESCGEMVGLIDTLLDVYRFEAGKMVLAFRQEEPQALIHRTLIKFRSVAKRTGLNLYATIEEGLPLIPVDRHKFSRLLNNLLSNAVKFTSEGGEIELKAEMAADFAALRGRIPEQLYPAPALPEGGAYLQISVRDSGVGIPAVDLVNIFDRYTQAKNRRLGKSQGTGLGLTFCRKVMDAHEGYIWAESSKGKGSTFYLLFPLG